MNILVLGASGMAGHTITLYFLKRGHEVTTFTRKPFPFGYNVRGDIRDEKLLKQLLARPFDVVINCLGVLNQTCDEHPSQAIYVNSYLPHFIHEQLLDKPAYFIHMSTDCVFSGQSGPYDELSFPDGRTLYDRTKALGELNHYQSLTFRNSIIGPDMKSDGIGLFNWFMKQQSSIHGYTRAIWTGVTTLTLAKAMEHAISERITGLYNLVHPASISKYDLLQLFNKHFKDGRLDILPADAVRVDKTLINHRKDFTFKVPHYEQMVVEMKEWIKEHHYLYPHYDKS